VENYVDKLGVTTIESWMGQQPHYEKCIGGSNNGVKLGSKEVNQPNRPRPPNQGDTPPSILLTSSIQHTDDLSVEGETFEDARDQGIHGSYDSDMDLTVETISLEQ
jgi:hypothetical protein